MSSLALGPSSADYVNYTIEKYLRRLFSSESLHRNFLAYSNSLLLVQGWVSSNEETLPQLNSARELPHIALAVRAATVLAVCQETAENHSPQPGWLN